MIISFRCAAIAERPSSLRGHGNGAAGWAGAAGLGFGCAMGARHEAQLDEAAAFGCAMGARHEAQLDEAAAEGPSGSGGGRERQGGTVIESGRQVQSQARRWTDGHSTALERRESDGRAAEGGDGERLLTDRRTDGQPNTRTDGGAAAAAITHVSGGRVNISFRCAAIAERPSGSHRNVAATWAGNGCRSLSLPPHRGPLPASVRLRLSLPLSLPAVSASHHLLLCMSSCRHAPQKEWPQPSTRGRRSSLIDEPPASEANGSRQREQLCASQSAGGEEEEEGEGAGEAMVAVAVVACSAVRWCGEWLALWANGSATSFLFVFLFLFLFVCFRFSEISLFARRSTQPLRLPVARRSDQTLAPTHTATHTSGSPLCPLRVPSAMSRPAPADADRDAVAAASSAQPAASLPHCPPCPAARCV